MAENIDIIECCMERKLDSRIYTEFVAACFDPQKTSEILRILAEDVPLSEFNVLHAKRVRKARDLNNVVETLVCPLPRVEDLPARVEKLLQESSNRRVVNVARYAPNTHAEFEEWNKEWPVTFHINELERQRLKGLEESDKQNIRLNFQALCEDHDSVVRDFGFLQGGGLLVNPINNVILCTVYEAFDFAVRAYGLETVLANPLLSCTLLCVDYVSKMAREIVPGKDKLAVTHYLCTGLDIYLFQEPDMMESMALVHSRIRRVFIAEPDPLNGALVSGSHHIHCLRSLNHHYRVFRCTRLESRNPSGCTAASSDLSVEGTNDEVVAT